MLKGKHLKCQLYVCKKQGPSWADPEPLPFNVDTDDLRRSPPKIGLKGTKQRNVLRGRTARI